MSEFHKRLNDLKKASGETQVKIAAALGITPQALSYYTNGREPGYNLLVKIANYFGCSIDYLLGRSEIRDPKNEVVSVELGLTEASIENIKKCTKKSLDIDCLLSSFYFLQLVQSLTVYWHLEDQKFLDDNINNLGTEFSDKDATKHVLAIQRRISVLFQQILEKHEAKNDSAERMATQADIDLF